MRKTLLALAGLVLVGSVFTGCTSVHNYSLRSYQGPLPMGDYRYIDNDRYGTPTTWR